MEMNSIDLDAWKREASDDLGSNPRFLSDSEYIQRLRILELIKRVEYLEQTICDYQNIVH